MERAILIIDMPKDCLDCPCLKSDDFDDWCAVTKEAIYSFEGRERTCPLMPAPEKQLIWFEDERSDWDRGYNQCIDEILGE